MDPKELFTRALQHANKAVGLVKPGDFELPTPDTEWNVRQLANHMLYELSWVADIVRGATIDQVGNRYEGDLIGTDLQQAWKVAAHEAEQAISKSYLDMDAHLSYGDVPMPDYLREVAGDELIHAWDLSVALHNPIDFDTAVAQAIYDFTLPKAATMHETGLYAPPLLVAKDADLQTKLLAMFGRDVQWSALKHAM